MNWQDIVLTITWIIGLWPTLMSLTNAKTQYPRPSAIAWAAISLAEAVVFISLGMLFTAFVCGIYVAAMAALAILRPIKK
jgi:hypothetical protein